ncbi:MAG: thiamine pyrophosphate-binding protein, partial [Candidatus Angelobacter sp.]
VVRHEQAAGFAADGFYRHSGRPAAIFASTGPGNLFTLVPLLESLQSNTPVLLIGTNIASPLQTGSGGALHETPEQIEIVRPLTRYARRVSSPEEIPRAVAEAADVLYGNLPGPAFIEVPHDLLAAAVSAQFPGNKQGQNGSIGDDESGQAATLLRQSRKPVILIGGGVREGVVAVRHLAEMLQAPVFTTTSGKGQFADDHPLAMGCISRLGTVQEIFGQSDLLISFAARLTEFDTGRFGLVLPEDHIQVVEDAAYPGNRITPKLQLVGKIRTATAVLAQGLEPRGPWCDIAALIAAEKAKLESLNADGYSALSLLRGALRRDDVVVNDQSILNYWASAFFPVLAPGTFIYPYGSGTL